MQWCISRTRQSSQALKGAWGALSRLNIMPQALAAAIQANRMQAHRSWQRPAELLRSELCGGTLRCLLVEWRSAFVRSVEEEVTVAAWQDSELSCVRRNKPGLAGTRQGGMIWRLHERASCLAPQSQPKCDNPRRLNCWLRRTQACVQFRWKSAARL